MQAAACAERIAFGPRAGQKVLTLQGAMPRDKDFKKTPCADIDGFSLHAAVRCGADDRQALEQLWRHHASGHVAAGVHSAAGGAGAPPAYAPDRFHGVPAPTAKLRALVAPQVVPQEPEAHQPEAKPADCEANRAHHRPVRLSWAKLLKRVFDLDLEHCPNCGGELKIIAAILEQPVIEKILTHLGLHARAPPRAPARGQALQAA